MYLKRLISLAIIAFSSSTFSFENLEELEENMCDHFNLEATVLAEDRYKVQGCSGSPRYCDGVPSEYLPRNTRKICSLNELSGTEFEFIVDYKFVQDKGDEDIQLNLKSLVKCIKPVYDEQNYECFYENQSNYALITKGDSVKSTLHSFPVKRDLNRELR